MRIFQDPSLPHVHHQFLVYVLLLSTSVASISTQAELSSSITKGNRLPRDITDSSLGSEQFVHFVTIDPDDDKAENYKTCHPPDEGGKSNVSCKNLDNALQAFHNFSSVVFYLASPSDTYYLNFTLNVTNQCNIGFYGNNSLYPLIPMIKCKQNVGLSFTNSSNITFSSVQLFNCGGTQKSTSKDFSRTQSNATYFLAIRVGLYFYNCTNITMYHIQVLNSSQAIGVVMYDTNGVVEVNSSIFANNTVLSDGSQAGGGGFTVEFTYCKLGDITCDDKKYDSINKRNKNSTYLFDNCTFKDNIAHNLKSNGHYVVPSKSGHDATGRGGGLSIFFRGDAMNNSVSIVDSRFIANNALWGGGLRIEMTDNTINNTATLLRCKFDQNHNVITKYGRYTGGGGLHVATTTYYWDNVHKAMSKSKIHIKDCSFSHNRAMEGGAICFTTALQNGISSSQAIEMLIVNSTIEFNQAKLGSAVILTIFPIFNVGVLSQVKFYDCKFLNNNNLLPETVAIHQAEIAANNLLFETVAMHQAGMAAVYISEVPVSFHNITTFYNNTGSALVVVGSQVNFSSSTACFEKNEGSDGGAIALLGATSILIGPNTTMMFVDNIASGYGGAIYNRYISNEYLESTTDCFFRYTEPFLDPSRWNVQFNFSGNRAAQDGCSIFSTSVYPCLWGEVNLPQGNVSNVFRWNDRWKYVNPKCEHEIYTEPKNFSFHNQSSTDPINFFPGQRFRLPLDAWDDFGHNVTDDAVYSASVVQDKVSLSNPIAEVDPGYTYITANQIRITGKPGNNITLVMQTKGSQKIYLTFNLTILMCPPGFVPGRRADDYHFNNLSTSAKEIKCECPPDNCMYRGHLKCNSELFNSKIDTRYWYGSVNTKGSGGENSTLHLMGTAPFAYRFVSQGMDDTSIDLPRNIDEVEELLCGSVNRKGVLCGECVDGYAVAVNSPTYECVPCNSNSTTTGEFIKHLSAYIALTYIPIVIVFILIIFFNIKLASSAAAGFVLYAQTISSGYFDITGYNVLYPGAHNRAPRMALSKYTTHIYGILNLDSFAFLMHPFCLNKHFTTLHVLCLDYATAVFPLVVIVAIYLAYRCKLLTCKCSCQRRQQMADDPDPSSTTSLQNITAPQRPYHNRAPRNTLIHAFTAFMLLSYTKFSLASIRTVVIGDLFDAEGNSRSRRIYLAGHLSFGDSHFLFPFGILAILVLVLIVFLPPLLLLGPLQCMDWLADKPGLSYLRRYWPSITIHTILDTFQGYKPNRRFFGGLYLFFRLIMFLIYSFSQALLTQYAIQLIVIFSFAILVSLVKPYANDFYNYLDTLLFLNLGILNALAIYASEHRDSIGVYTVECILIFLPLIYMICYVIWNRVHRMNNYKAIKENLTSHLINPVRTIILRNKHNKRLLKNDSSYLFSESIYYSGDNLDEEMFQRAAKGNRYQAANAQMYPQIAKRPGEVSKTVVSILDTQLPEQIEEEEKISMQESSVTYDSGIGRQSNCNTGGLDSEC